MGNRSTTTLTIAVADIDVIVMKIAVTPSIMSEVIDQYIPKQHAIAIPNVSAGIKN